MLGGGAKANWVAQIEVASRRSVPISLDLNHRPQLGTLEELWSIVEPLLPHIRVLVLSVASVRGLSKIFGLTDCSDLTLLRKIHAKLMGPVVACCFKSRSKSGVQTRWSAIIDGHGVSMHYVKHSLWIH